MIVLRSRCRAAAAALLAAALLAACGDAGGSAEPQLGTVSIVNQSDQGMAPLTVVGFFLQPVGVLDPGPNLLAEEVPPGGVVVVGLYPPGLYNATAMLAGGTNIQFMDVVVRANEPTDFVIPAM